jgi:ABC-2 type transport system ATP-binding protein
MTQSIIHVDNLKRSFKKVDAVKGVSFSVAEGEVFGFLGPNGAGKTTTISMLCTMLKPSSGTATLNGFDIVRQKDRVRHSIGIVFQDTTLDHKLTAYENLMLHCRLYGVAASERKSRIAEVLDIVELGDKRKHIVETFSGGMKRRLEIARGLLHYPKVLFLDEPTIGLDPQTRAHIWDYVTGLRKTAGITIFLTTHYMEEAEICDRIAVMDNGALVALDTPAALKAGVGGDIVELSTTDNVAARAEIATRFGIDPSLSGNVLSLKTAGGGEFLVRLVKELTVPITNVNLRRPTLNDVFLALTGRQIREEEAPKNAGRHSRMRRGFH